MDNITLPPKGNLFFENLKKSGDDSFRNRPILKGEF